MEEQNDDKHIPDGIQLDYTINDTYKVMLSTTSKEVQLSCYAKLAETYDEDVLGEGYEMDAHLRDLLFAHCAAAPMRLMDAGCGTGLSLRAIRPEATRRNVEMYAVGVDYSPEMLNVARKRDWYDEFVVADLEERLPLEEESFDSFVCSGLFLAGHCGPSALVNIVRCLKFGGVGVFTVRRKTYVVEEREYLEAIDKAGCDVLFNEERGYFGVVTANYVVIKRVRNCI